MHIVREIKKYRILHIKDVMQEEGVSVWGGMNFGRILGSLSRPTLERILRRLSRS